MSTYADLVTAARHQQRAVRQMALIRSIVGHATDDERALDEIAAVLDGATLAELVERRGS